MFIKWKWFENISLVSTLWFNKDLMNGHQILVAELTISVKEKEITKKHISF